MLSLFKSKSAMDEREFILRQQKLQNYLINNGFYVFGKGSFKYKEQKKKETPSPLALGVVQPNLIKNGKLEGILLTTENFGGLFETRKYRVYGELMPDEIILYAKEVDLSSKINSVFSGSGFYSDNLKVYRGKSTNNGIYEGFFKHFSYTLGTSKKLGDFYFETA